MKYNQIGNSGIKISEIGFGTIPILSGALDIMPNYFNLSDESAVKLLRKAFDYGINFFDTAVVPEYGDAERKLGMAFSDLREKVVFASKARAFTKKAMKSAIEQSLHNLRTDYIDIYLVHQLRPDSVQLAVDEDNGALAALLEARKKGDIRLIGIGTHYAKVASAVEQMEDVSIIQMPFNILETGIYITARESSPDLSKKIVFHKILAGGALTPHFSLNKLLRTALNESPLSVLIGLGTELQLEQMMTSYTDEDSNFELDCGALSAAFVCNRCQKCRCINDLRISHLMRYRAYALLGFRRWALDKWLENRHNISYCNNCEQECVGFCPRELDIPKLLLDADHYFENLVEQGG